MFAEVPANIQERSWMLIVHVHANVDRNVNIVNELWTFAEHYWQVRNGIIVVQQIFTLSWIFLSILQDIIIFGVSLTLFILTHLYCNIINWINSTWNCYFFLLILVNHAHVLLYSYFKYIEQFLVYLLY